MTETLFTGTLSKNETNRKLITTTKQKKTNSKIRKQPSFVLALVIVTSSTWYINWIDQDDNLMKEYVRKIQKMVFTVTASFTDPGIKSANYKNKKFVQLFRMT